MKHFNSNLLQLIDINLFQHDKTQMHKASCVLSLDQNNSWVLYSPQAENLVQTQNSHFIRAWDGIVFSGWEKTSEAGGHQHLSED